MPLTAKRVLIFAASHERLADRTEACETAKPPSKL